MKKSLNMKMLAFLPLMFVLLGASCSENTRPENTTERLFVAQWALIGATNSVADLKDTMNPDDYAVAKQIVLDAGLVLACGKHAAGIPGAGSVAGCPIVPDGSAISYLALLNSLLIKAAAYSAARGEGT